MKKKKKIPKKKTSEQMQRRKTGSARGISSYENFMLTEAHLENKKLKRKLKLK